MSWRPKDWKEIKKEILNGKWMIPSQTEFPIVIPSSFEFDLMKSRLIEAGADAILDKILKTWICFVPDGIDIAKLEGKKTHCMIIHRGKGMCFIPDVEGIKGEVE